MSFWQHIELSGGPYVAPGEPRVGVTGSLSVGSRMSDYDAGIWGVFVDIRTDPQMGATAMIGLRFDPAVPLTLVLMPFAMR